MKTMRYIIVIIMSSLFDAYAQPTSELDGISSNQCDMDSVQEFIKSEIQNIKQQMTCAPNQQMCGRLGIRLYINFLCLFETTFLVYLVAHRQWFI